MMCSLVAKVLKITNNSVVVEFKDHSQGETPIPENFKVKESDFVSVIMPDSKLSICSPIPSTSIESWMW